MWAICELKTNYALKHTYQLRGICELTSETYFHVALAEQLSVFKSLPILLGTQPPSSNCLLLDSLLPLEFPLPSVAGVPIFLELHIVRVYLSRMRERSSVVRENTAIFSFSCN